VGAAERVDVAAQAGTCRIRNVHDRDRPGSLAERDPEPVARTVFCHVMGSVADIDAACHAPPGEVDHDELPAGVVGDIREASVSADQGDVRRAEAPQHFHDPQTAEVDESHGCSLVLTTTAVRSLASTFSGSAGMRRRLRTRPSGSEMARSSFMVSA
jgi:hypothetical protein